MPRLQKSLDTLRITKAVREKSSRFLSSVNRIVTEGRYIEPSVLLETRSVVCWFVRSGVDNGYSRRYSLPFENTALFGSEHAEAPCCLNPDAE